MWVEKSPGQRASRVAIAGSIYMRKASLDVIKSKQLLPEHNENAISRRNPSYGKIVKNVSRKVDSKPLQQINNYYRKEFSPYNQKKNMISSFKLELERKTPTPSFGHYEQLQNSKIKSIEQKYRAMLSDYEVKKKTISSQLQSLKTSSKTEIRARPTSSIQKPKYTERQCGGIKSNKQQNKYARNNQNILKQYEQHSKQLIVEKLACEPRNISGRKKQKITQLHPMFFKNLRNQIKLEQQLRILKSSIKPEKKQEVQKYILENQPESLKVLDLDPQQFDPFEHKTHSDLSAAALATKLIKKHRECEDQWRNTCNLTSRKEAKQIFQEINFEKCQEISLKAFVRELSFLLQKHLRNRDLLRIYNRLSPLTQHNFCEVTAHKE